MSDKISTLNGKSQDTEEWFDLVFTRPLGQMWANLFARLGVHPNVVTVLGIVLGVMASFCYYFEDNYSMTLLGIFLLQLYDPFLQSPQGVVRKHQSSRKITGYFSIYHMLYLQEKTKSKSK